MNQYDPFKSIHIKKKNQADVLATDIKKRIIGGQLRPGKIFANENDLCKELSVSRATLREAYKILEIEGYISRTKRGTFANNKEKLALSGHFTASLELAEYSDIIEFLSILEPEAVAIAAKRVTNQQLSEIYKYMLKCEQSKNVTGAVEDYNYQFHLRIRLASQNQVIVSALSASYDKFNEKIIRKLIRKDRDGFLDQCFKEHRQLFQAIQVGNSTTAKKIAYKHLMEDIEQYELI